ncbi:MAG TPA: hypothetical protein VF469_11085, partial [Kofleriaceae bacterium]
MRWNANTVSPSPMAWVRVASGTRLPLPPVAFLRRLCGIIPPPRRHLVRYAGLFGPASKARAK